MFLISSVRKIFPDLCPSARYPAGVDFNIEGNNGITIRSFLWTGERIRRARLCQLTVPGKFSAETLVMYPEFEFDVPIFGCEYLTIGGKKYFAGADFHPLSQNKEYLDKYIVGYLDDFPNRTQDSSKFYDFSKFFSNKFWIKKSEEDFYSEYVRKTTDYLLRYKRCLTEAKSASRSFSLEHAAYDTHMAENDPAKGILKAYFSKDFAETYIHKFLFDLSQ